MQTYYKQRDILVKKEFKPAIGLVLTFRTHEEVVHPTKTFIHASSLIDAIFHEAALKNKPKLIDYVV